MVAFGFDKDEGDNSYFTSATYYKMTTLDKDGNSLDSEILTFNLTAPSSPGNYTLHAKAVNAEGPSYTKKSDIHYIFTDYSISIIKNNQINKLTSFYEIDCLLITKKSHLYTTFSFFP